jgi:hypothetical protein
MAIIDTNSRTPSKAVHAGVNVAVCKLSLSLACSLGDVYRIGKLPHKAIPLGAIWYPGPALPAANNIVSRFGTSASQELFLPSASYSAAPFTTGVRALGRRQMISLSDDQTAARWENIIFRPVAGSVATQLSSGYMGDLVVLYTLDDPA